MSKTIQTPPTSRRWLKSVIAASSQPLPAYPWMRGQRSHAGADHPAANTPAVSHSAFRPASLAAR